MTTRRNCLSVTPPPELASPAAAVAVSRRVTSPVATRVANRRHADISALRSVDNLAAVEAPQPDYVRGNGGAGCLSAFCDRFGPGSVL